METIKLSNVIEMPVMGYGVYQIPQEDCQRCIEEAFSVGYRLIDTAAAYMNEEAVGKAIEHSGLPRQDIFVTTKLWLQDASYEQAKTACKRSMDRLRLDYLDLYLIHKPLGDYYGAWRALEELYQEGLIRAIGVCNFYPDRLVDLCCNTEISPMVNQMETHVFWQHNNYQKLMSTYGVQLESWGAFAEGRNNFFSDPILSEIGRVHDKTAAQVALRWLIQRGIVCIPKSTHIERMKQNLDALEFTLSDNEMERIKTLDRHQSLFYSHYDPKMVAQLNHTHYPI